MPAPYVPHAQVLDALMTFVLPGLDAFGWQGQRRSTNTRAGSNCATTACRRGSSLPQGQPLPYNLSGVGAPATCVLRVDPLINTFVVVSNPSALFTRAAAPLALPPHPLLVGAILYSQWLCFDSGVATPLAVTVSDAQAITLGSIAMPPMPHAARTIWKYGAIGLGNDHGRMVPDDYGPILRFN